MENADCHPDHRSREGSGKAFSDMRELRVHFPWDCDEKNHLIYGLMLKKWIKEFETAEAIMTRTGVNYEMELKLNDYL